MLQDHERRPHGGRGPPLVETEISRIPEILETAQVHTRSTPDRRRERDRPRGVPKAAGALRSTSLRCGACGRSPEDGPQRNGIVDADLLRGAVDRAPVRLHGADEPAVRELVAEMVVPNRYSQGEASGCTTSSDRSSDLLEEAEALPDTGPATSRPSSWQWQHIPLSSTARHKHCGIGPSTRMAWHRRGSPSPCIGGQAGLL